MRNCEQSLGTAVFFGMLGVTGFGLLFTPVFYSVVQRLFHARVSGDASTEAAAEQARARNALAEHAIHRG